ncbi:replicative DNA helicase, partial [Bordetella avium]
GEIDTQRIRSGRLSPDDYTRLTGALGRLQDQRLVIADDPGMASVARIRLAARKVRQRQGKLDLIVIDYLQLMRGEGGNRNEELG